MGVSQVTVPAAGTWVELTGGAAPTGKFQFTVAGTVAVMVRYQDAAPSALALGDLYKVGMGDRPDLTAATGLDTRAWAKIEPGSPREGTVIVTVP